MNQIAPVTADADFGLPTFGMAPGLAIMFNERLYKRCKEMATNMSQAHGIVPPHLIEKPLSCFAVLTRAITWKLDPFAVAQCTYETPGGKVGYEGKLVQAILEQSGQLEGTLKYELFGDWSRVRGKFKKAKSERGKEYFVIGWDVDKDEEGLGVRVSGKVKGEIEPRAEEFFLKSFWPRNSTLWALRPEQQIKYAAARAFANTAMPGILMGVPFNDDNEAGMRDVTPSRPQRQDFVDGAATVDWSKATDVEDAGTSGEEDTADIDAKTGAADDQGKFAQTEEAQTEEPTEFGHADAHALGGQARDAGKALASVPADLATEFHDAWQDGWRARDDEIAAEKKAAGKK